MAYLYRDNYPSNEVDIPHNSQSPSPSMPSMPSATSTKGVSCSVAGAGKVTLIGSNCPASRVGRCVDCEGGRTAQIFSDCAITKYLNRATARQPCGRQTIAAVESLHSCYCLAASTHSSSAELPWTSTNTGRPRTVASPVAHDRRLAGRPVSRHLQRRVPYGCIVPSLVGTGMLDVGYSVRSGVNADLLLYR